jgi:RimJ/RimL family protein N-acetyltransferase
MVPTLETERLLLAPRVLADLEDYVAMDSDRAVREYITPPFRDDFTPELYRANLPARIATDFGPVLGFWTLRLKAPAPVFVGMALLMPVEGKGPEVEIGWRMPRAAWGHGYASEAALTVLAYGRGTLGLAEVVALINPENLRSIAVATKLGMTRAGRRDAYGTSFDLYRIGTKLPDERCPSET